MIYNNIISMSTILQSKKYKCNICDKIYASYKSYWNHNNKFHKTTIDEEITIRFYIMNYYIIKIILIIIFIITV